MHSFDTFFSNSVKHVVMIHTLDDLTAHFLVVGEQKTFEEVFLKHVHFIYMLRNDFCAHFEQNQRKSINVFDFATLSV